MPKGSFLSKALAATFIVLTISVIGGIITMIILYKTEISGMNPTARPTLPPTTTAPPPVMRLPPNLVPERYTIFIQPHFYTKIIEEVNVTSPNQTMLFTGNSTVEFRCVERTSTIYLNSKDLKVSNPLVKNTKTNEKIPHSSMISHDDESNFLEIPLNEHLEAGKNYSLFLDFEGEISVNLEGLYLSSYVEGGPAYEGDRNAERFLVATNLQPTDARRVFPCFDEPQLKAEFDVTIIHRRGTDALGNAKVEDFRILDDEWEMTRFKLTPRMSTYLFAFTVSEFEEFTVSKPTPENVDVKIYARPDAVKAKSTEYAASITGNILMFYEDLFDMTYSRTLGKLDQIALPDLYPAAMENWGLVTYQEGGLLYEEGVSSLLHKEEIVTVIAHELAHQWFGNLVTMKWWNDIWLNEGFATYMSYFAVDNVEPSFNVKDMYAMNDLHIAFQEDALASSHPLSPPQEDVQTTSQITEMFDSITYSKGATILRMLSDIVGEKVFNKAVKMYLKEFAYKSAEQKNLWEKIILAGEGQFNDIAMKMEPWTKQIGYPVITINTTIGEVYQKHFLFNSSSESSLWWYIPIRVMPDTSTDPVWLLSNERVRNEKFLSEPGKWILANVNCTGYYRVNYNPENWEHLLTQLEVKPSPIPLMNRAQLIDDAFNLARAKLVDVTLALNTTRFLHSETEYLPWESAVRNLEYFFLMFDRSEVYGPMQAYLQEQVKGLYDFFSNYTDHSQVPKDHSSQYSQIIAIEVACSNGLKKCVTMASSMFSLWMNGTNIINPNLRSVIYCQAVAAGGKEEWEFAWERFQTTNDTSEKEQLRKALSCTKTTWLLGRYLDYTLNPEKIRLMDVASTIIYIAKNEAAQAQVWNFIRAHWDYISLGDGAMVIQAVTDRFSTKFELEELERFAKDYDLRSATRAVEQAIEQTQVNIQWVRENKDNVLEWFEKNI
ncbi:alanyl (membrane) aminopeptidase a [Anabas testudineus]|uniref:Aminopeptidase n=1 Tax=Anabas testudineus TaxID=64144 RepID=A0A3Q1HUE2_ANATE|nr:alanyl (membrane) aminopeptidase a [Anabas testudineus]